MKVLQTAMDRCEEAFRIGEYDFETVYTSFQLLNSAKLDICETDAERIVVLEKAVIESTLYEDRLKDLSITSGEITKLQVLRAEANRLSVEIELERVISRVAN